MDPHASDPLLQRAIAPVRRLEVVLRQYFGKAFDWNNSYTIVYYDHTALGLHYFLNDYINYILTIWPQMT